MSVQIAHCHCCGSRAFRADVDRDVKEGYCGECREGLGQVFQQLLQGIPGKHVIELLPYRVAAMALEASGNQLYTVKPREGSDGSPRDSDAPG